MTQVLDELLGLLTLEATGKDLFLGQSQDLGFRRLFGGQVLALAVCEFPIQAMRCAVGFILLPRRRLSSSLQPSWERTVSTAILRLADGLSKAEQGRSWTSTQRSCATHSMSDLSWLAASGSRPSMAKRVLSERSPFPRCPTHGRRHSITCGPLVARRPGARCARPTETGACATHAGSGTGRRPTDR